MAAFGQPMPAGFAAPAGAVGVEHIATMPSVAERVNLDHFNQMRQGAILRMAGMLTPPDGQGAVSLKTADGGMLSLNLVFTGSLGHLTGPVEVIGSKQQPGCLTAACILPLPGDCDLALWDEFVKLGQTPQLGISSLQAMSSEPFRRSLQNHKGFQKQNGSG
eukprot:CAMPEP_0197664164 /NCGR_PEP_ID=MMETSP1338-20131121/58471_1 /TAXON_ID=43686 ORGANISM="Pelagodinium beii, Strain RCC1491" /NCGR_SAMPLE_ID=MMETSP1338 /ASSEMBLY_ACC=CAM_ASM_000754 /LENGTH=161 /DNA_ID=CAMNT_0043242745 /DNA_START=27 /DNA_END=509 /DNA_ORIENTATION=+